MEKSMEEKIREYMNTWEMIRPGDRVIAAVSGGADSVCLLWALQKIAPELPAFLRVVHVHHGLRGEEADRDENFVRQLCESLGICFRTVHCNAALYAKEHGMSTEEAGRELRYKTFEEEALLWEKEERLEGCLFEALRPVKIAVAHHREDSAETVLFNLARGSGLRGISGIRPVQGRIIRPLLCTGREEICDWLRREGLSWCEDSTNQSEDYTRNVIRHRILPLMRERVNQRAEENILRAADMIAQADEYLEIQADKVWKEAGSTGCEEDFFAEIDCRIFLEQPEIIKNYLIRRMLDVIMVGWKDITGRHFAAIRELAAKQVGSRISLPCKMTAEKTYETLRIYKKKIAVKKSPEMLNGEKKEGRRLEIKGEYPLVIQTEIPVENLEINIFSREKAGEIPKNQYTKWFDYDKITDMLSYRRRCPGDFIMLSGGGKKMVARCMIDDKIPREEREKVPVLAEGSHALWVAGGRISEYYKITDQTKTIVQITYHGGEKHGR